MELASFIDYLDEVISDRTTLGLSICFVHLLDRLLLGFCGILLKTILEIHRTAQQKLIPHLERIGITPRMQSSSFNRFQHTATTVQIIWLRGPLEHKHVVMCQV